MTRQRFRIRFRKHGDLRLISHRDLLRTLERLFRRAELKLRMSEGFHPKPRMSFPSALALGVEGRDEVMELELEEIFEANELLARLQQHTVPGLTFNRVEILAPESKKGQLQSVTFEFPVPAPRHADVAAAIERFLAQDSHPLARPGRVVLVDIRRDVELLELREDRLFMRLAVTRDASVRPRDLLEMLGLDDLEQEGHYLMRTGVHLISQETL